MSSDSNSSNNMGDGAQQPSAEALANMMRLLQMMGAGPGGGMHLYVSPFHNFSYLFSSNNK
jgi:hypothetical protein